MPTFATPAPITAALDLGVGNVTIVASDRTDTVVDVRPADPNNPNDVRAAEATRVSFDDGRLQIVGHKPKWYTSGKKSESVAIRIELPTGSSVRATSPFGDFDLGGGFGDVRLDTAFGEISVEQAASLVVKTAMGQIDVGRVAGRAEVQTSSGNVRVHRVGGEAVVKNTNGTSHLGRVDGDVRVANSNGDIEVDFAGAGVSAKTANGRIRLAHVENGEVEALTAVGSVEVGVLRGVPAHLDVQTTIGRVYNELGAGEAPMRGEQSVRLRLRSTTSDITVRYAEAG
ncbi:DUF4097 family beta strand repeat-containing protein [Catenulispora yoronensis]|uniref:DUF4097 family beta strand repeat-containing protein n=1 Tax=Catenulispora yoronensis TaxID=450799 RepID=A0ABN2V670_9ACTN